MPPANPPPRHARTRSHPEQSLRRIIGRDDPLHIRRKGLNHLHWNDLYHSLLTVDWGWLIVILGTTYLSVNILFAIAYAWGGDCIANARPGVVLDTFFFSVQTLGSIGYGAMYPTTTYAHSLVTLESMVGLLGIALATGLMFARFSRPTARVMFTDMAVITSHNGQPTLMFRAGNQRRNQILEAQLWLTLVRNEITQEGTYMRRFYDLNLVRRHTPIFALTWTAMHVIDDTSPLFGLTATQLETEEVELVVILTGLDETFSQTIHARHSYIAAEVQWHMRFADILSRTPAGERQIDYTQFNRLEPTAVPPA